MEAAENSPKPNWLELPIDLTKDILKRLDTFEIVTSARNVCPLWWNICKDPLMWRTIRMHVVSLKHYDNEYPRRLEKICHYAIDQSCGHLKDISIKYIGTNDILEHITKSTGQLRRIGLEHCYHVSNEIFIEVVKKQPFLEEIDIRHCFLEETGFFESIGKCCRHLKSMTLEPYMVGILNCDDDAYAISKTMPGLRRLSIVQNGLTNDGLLAILDGCPLLEYLDLRGCRHLDLSGSLGKRLKERVKELLFPTEFIDNKFSHHVLSLIIRL